MENFIVSARKYRPVTFDSVIGQNSITATLKNAISSSHLAHAYLFCGPRGVGKTTCARIFAKTINCSNISENVEPCNNCESCRSFNDSRSFNIHELDAASNNSVDDIRTLIEQVRIPPQVGRYSVYIIDEVHMLSASAFNAFLKTLEEPPKHAVFILATTEKHKIIPTILSRCQIYDFSRIKVEDAVYYLEKISKNEKTEYEPDALNIIAQKAEGSMRDALSIYDQIVSFSGGKITYKNVIETLNVLDYEYYFRLTDAFIEGNITGSLLIFDEILSKGFDPHNFITGLSKHFRDLLVCKDTATLQLLDLSNNIKERYKQQTAQCPADILFEYLNLCGQCDINFRLARNHRLHVELLLVQLCRIADKKKSSNEITDPVENTATESKKSTETLKQPVVQKQTENDTINEIPKDILKEPSITEKYRSATPSIKNLINSKSSNSSEDGTETAVTENDELIEHTDSEVREQPFSGGQLLKVYNLFLDSIKVDKPRLYSTLNTQQPEITETNTIVLTLSNRAQLDDFNKNLKENMLSFLRNGLQNEKIVLDIAVSKHEEKNKLYTSEEKFKYLLKKNPALGKLKKQLDLDFE